MTPASWRGSTAAAALRLLAGRFTWTTIALLILALAVNAIPQDALRELIVDLIFTVLVFFAVWTVGRRLRLVTVFLALPVLIGQWTLHLHDSHLLRVMVFGIITVFFAFLTLVILFAVLRDRVTADTIVGAVCVYFLLGVTWGTAYSLLVLVSPDALSISDHLARAAGWAPPKSPINPLMQYYSFTSLTTQSYGDITPVSGGARILSVLEGLTGQLYPAVLIARLVGVHVGRTSRQ